MPRFGCGQRKHLGGQHGLRQGAKAATCRKRGARVLPACPTSAVGPSFCDRIASIHDEIAGPACPHCDQISSVLLLPCMHICFTAPAQQSATAMADTFRGTHTARFCAIVPLPHSVDGWAGISAAQGGLLASVRLLRLGITHWLPLRMRRRALLRSTLSLAATATTATATTAASRTATTSSFTSRGRERERV